MWRFEGKDWSTVLSGLIITARSLWCHAPTTSLQLQTKTAPCSFQWKYIEAHKWVLGSKMLKAMKRGIVPSLDLPVTKHSDQKETNIILRDAFGLVANTPAIVYFSYIKSFAPNRKSVQVFVMYMMFFTHTKGTSCTKLKKTFDMLEKCSIQDSVRIFSRKILMKRK